MTVKKNGDSRTLGIDLFGDLERVRVGEVGVRGGNGEDEAALATDELKEHVPYLDLNISGCGRHRDLGHPRQVNQGQVENWNDVIIIIIIIITIIYF